MLKTSYGWSQWRSSADGAKLQTKLSGQVFHCVYESNIEEDESVTFPSMCKKLRSAIQTSQRIVENLGQNNINGEYFGTSI